MDKNIFKRTQWMPEIRTFCPDTPVLLVGCKNDLRFLFKDPAYLAFCRERSPFIRPTREADLVMPEQARALAAEFNLPYYETSVFTLHGVNQVFENAIRAALLARRNQHFWMTNALKHVQELEIQAPYCPPKNELNKIEIFPGNFWGDIKKMVLGSKYNCFPDLIFVTGEEEIAAHKFIVASGAPYLARFFDLANSRRSSESSNDSESTVDETEPLMSNGQKMQEGLIGIVNSTYSSCSDLEWKILDGNNIYCPMIECVRTRYSEENLGYIHIIQLSDLISPDSVRALLYFLYTGEFPQNFQCSQEEMIEAGEVFKIPELTNEYYEAWMGRNVKLMSDLKKSYRQMLKGSIWQKCTIPYHTDVLFHLDDGKVSAHRALLMCRSEVFMAMFSGDFRERRSHSVSLPGVKRETFICFLEFLYTDLLNRPISLDTGIPLIELANRLCLPRLINLVENVLINDIAQKHSKGIDVTDDYIRILEPAQLHNADQLAYWSQWQLATNYDTVCRKHNKIFKELSMENRQWISNNRWPPIWYVKDYDYYQKAVMERFKSENPEKKSRKRNNSGCLCFPSGKSRKDEKEGLKDESIQSSFTCI